MANLDKKTQKKMEKLAETDATLEEIADELNLTYSSVYENVRLPERGFATLHEYNKHLAQQKGFATLHEYHEHLAQQKGFTNYTEYNEHLAQQRWFATLHEYNEHLAQQRGFATLHEYNEHLAQQRRQRTENQLFSSLLKGRLKEISKNQSWLAREIGISSAMVSNYINGKNVPTDKNFKKICQVLDLSYRTLGDIVKDFT